MLLHSMSDSARRQGRHPDPGQALQFSAATTKEMGMPRVRPGPGTCHEPSHPVLCHKPVGEPFFHKGPQSPVDAHSVESPAARLLHELPVGKGLFSFEQRFEDPSPRSGALEPDAAQHALRV